MYSHCSVPVVQLYAFDGVLDVVQSVLDFEDNSEPSATQTRHLLEIRLVTANTHEELRNYGTRDC